jgi:DNA-binding CsgD family transcriptional regulator
VVAVGAYVPVDLARRLGTAPNAVEIAKVVCSEIEAAFGVSRCVVTYFGPNGQPLMTVDNLHGVCDEQRLAALAGDGDSAGVEPDEATASRYQLVLPLVEPSGLLGSIGCGRDQSYSRELERALFALGTQVSVRLVHLGVTAAAARAATPKLTRRQHEVARLAAHGFTNSEIAADLGISPNTVKNRLKEVFERLGISGRIELVNALPRIAPDERVPLGVTRDGGLTITRVANETT